MTTSCIYLLDREIAHAWKKGNPSLEFTLKKLYIIARFNKANPGYFPEEFFLKGIGLSQKEVESLLSRLKFEATVKLQFTEHGKEEDSNVIKKLMTYKITKKQEA